MTTPKTDDLDATRTIIQALEPFDTKERERIIRWACEKLGMAPQTGVQSLPQKQAHVELEGMPHTNQQNQSHGAAKDIKTFLGEKSPKSNNQLAAAVAYYHTFEAPISERKGHITKDDLQNACRLAGLERLTKPEQTLVNAHNIGLLDKGSENGSYKINSVGENLVAMTMPSGTGTGKPKSRKTPPKKIAKKAAKKVGKKK